jgi:CDP-6-deoxy-D-xylo-4-hexulose-3-dehydrase
MIIKENSNLDRKSLIDLLTKKGIDTRPIVTGNFVKNKSVLKHFNYEVFGNLYNADYLENRGFFIGNSHIDLFAEINYLNSVLKSISS